VWGQLGVDPIQESIRLRYSSEDTPARTTLRVQGTEQYRHNRLYGNKGGIAKQEVVREESRVPSDLAKIISYYRSPLTRGDYKIWNLWSILLQV
jgi:hypothetical protein